MQTQDISKSSHALVATTILCLTAICYIEFFGDFGRFVAGIYDFLPRYTQAQMVGSDQMYNIEAGYRAQDRTVGLHESGVYPDRLPWQAVLMAPLGWLPYPVAYWTWIGSGIVCFAVFVRVWLLPHDCVLWGATFPPLALCLIMGQDANFLASCLAGVLLLGARRRDLAAGLLLALCTVKPHLFLLVPLALLAHRRLRLISGAVLGTAILLAAGTAAAGWGWPERWWLIVKTLSGDSDPGHDMSRCPSVFQLGMNPWTIGLAVAIALGIGILIWRSETLEAGIGLALIGGIVVAPHAAFYDLPLLLVALPILPLRGYAKWFRLALYSPIPYWMLLSGQPWNRLAPLILLATAILSGINRSTAVDRPGS